MPVKGFTCITIRDHVSDAIDHCIEEENKKAGYNKFSSRGQFVEYLMELDKNCNDKKESFQ